MMGNVWVFLGVTVVFLGGCAFMTGQALARHWRPAWQAAAYALGLAAAARFLSFALFGEALLSPAAYALDAAILVVVAVASHRMTRARRMVSQYPWLYARDGLFGWREIGTGRT